MRAIVTKEFDASAMQQRDDIAKLSVSLRKELEGKGITFIEVDRQPFREARSHPELAVQVHEVVEDQLADLLRRVIRTDPRVETVRSGGDRDHVRRQPNVCVENGLQHFERVAAAGQMMSDDERDETDRARAGRADPVPKNSFEN